MQHLDDRITELEQLVSGKHPNEAAFMASLKHKFATPEERAAQADKAQSLVGAGSHMVLSAEADQLRTSLADALARLEQMEERERKRNLAAEVAAANAPKK